MSNRAWTLVFLALVAVILYAIGFLIGSLVFVLIAVVSELWFWVKLLKSTKSKMNTK